MKTFVTNVGAAPNCGIGAHGFMKGNRCAKNRTIALDPRNEKKGSQLEISEVGLAARRRGKPFLGFQIRRIKSPRGKTRLLEFMAGQTKFTHRRNKKVVKLQGTKPRTDFKIMGFDL